MLYGYDRTAMAMIGQPAATLSPNISTTPVWQWGFRQCLPFSWTTLRGKHCRHPIAVMGVVDTFGLRLPRGVSE